MKFNDFVKSTLSNNIVCVVDDIINGKIIKEPEPAYKLIDGPDAEKEIDRFTIIPRTDNSKYKMLAVTFKKYSWCGKSDDCSYEYKCPLEFDTKKDAYNHMRDAALEKMKWNTEYEEDFDNSNMFLNYHVIFSREKIIHESYSGVYTYIIKEV